MHLACPDCGAPVQVNASFSNCAACGADVAAQIAPLDVSRAVYQRAVERFTAGNELAALEEIRNGIAVLDAPELHLLAALIHRKRSEFSDMRRHVAAIPMDDSLRREGEWLLRSHQEKLRQARMKEARKRRRSNGEADQPVGKANRQFSSEYYPFALDDDPVETRRRSRLPWALPIAAAILAVLFFVQYPVDSLLTSLLPAPGSQQAQPPAQQIAPTPATGTTAVSGNPTAPAASPPASDAPASDPPADGPVPQSTPVQPPTPALPSPTPFQEMVQQEEPAPAPPEPVAGSDAAALAAAIAATAQANAFDFPAFLISQERPDLAGLPVEAQLRDRELTLRGAVPLTSNRLDLLFLAVQAPGVESVNGIDLVVRLPQTYTVQTGDTLWSIAYKLYGDGARWEEVYAANEALLGNTTNLTVGQELTVPQELRQP